MAKFGLFSPVMNSDPLHVYEGDYMQQNGEYVTVYRRNTNPSMADHQVGAIKLDERQSVKEMAAGR
jgi:hypothetical protein